MSEVTVATTAELSAALSGAQSGDTILLQPGTYSGLLIKGLSFADGVTVTSADLANRAVLTNFQINASSGITFRSLEIALSGTGTYGVNIYTSSNLTFDQVSVHGSLDGNPQNDTGGLSFLNSQNITVTSSEFTELRQAVGVGGPTENVLIANNNAHLLMKTGFVFSGVSNVRVTGNVIGDIRPADGAHPDAIQFFTTGQTTAARDILVANNLIYRGDGAATQGIFFRDQTLKLPYVNVTIADNVVVGTGYGGIYASGINGLTVRGNELISMPGSENRTFLLVQQSDNVVSIGNRAVTISYDQVPTLRQEDNVVTRAVDDLGASVLKRWTEQHPEDLPLLTKFLPAPAPAPISVIDLNATIFGDTDWASGMFGGGFVFS